MKIMLVGYVDVVGRSIAARLHKEGHDVFWLTDSDDKELYSDVDKCKLYHQDIEMNRIKNIFLANSIDIIIFLACSFTNKQIHHNKEKSYLIPKLTNILENASVTGVNSFMLLTDCSKYSSMVDEDSVLLKSSEELCYVYQKSSDLKISIVRIPMVYGEVPLAQQGVFGKLLNHAKENGELTLSFKRTSFVHILEGRDVADAIYRILCEQEYGEWVLGLIAPYMASEFTRVIEEIIGKTVQIEWDNNEVLNIPQEDVLKFKERFGWITFHDFTKEREHLKPFLIIQQENIEKYEEVKKSSLPSWVKPTFENGLLFLIVAFFYNALSSYSDFRYIDIRLVYVVLIAAFYGKSQSVIAMTLACFHHGWSIWREGVDLSYLYYSVESWTPFAMYILGGASIGYLFDKKKDEMDSLANEYTLLSKKYNFLKDVYRDVCDIKNQLQRQIIVSKDSFGRVYEITRELDTLQPELIFFKTVSIMENIMGVNSVSIYTINNNDLYYARLIAHSKNLSGKLAASLKFEEYPELKKRMLERKLFVNKDLLPNYPAYVAPIMDGASFVAMVVVHEVDFQKFTLYYQNLFQIICGLVQNNVIKAYKFSQKGLESAYLGDTIIYKPKELEKQLQVLKDAKENVNVSYVQCKAIDLLNVSKEEFSSKVQRLLRSTDFIGLGSDNQYYIVFMQTDKKNMGLLYNRFKSQEIELEVIE